MKRKCNPVLTVLTVLLTTSATASPLRPALVIFGSKFDGGGFNQMAFKGAKRFKQDSGISYIEAQAMNDTQHLQNLRAVIRHGANFVVVAHAALMPSVETVAREFPRVRFVMIDSIARGPNIRSVLFQEQDGAYLVGMAAALKSQTGTIGFIGSHALPVIQAFSCGYVQGALSANPKIRIIKNMIANNPGGSFDPVRAGEIARSQFDRGADVVFAAAGPSSLGVLQRARDSGKLAIGVDSNKNHLYPGFILTSMVKRVDNAVYDAMQSGKSNSWRAGVTKVGLREHAIDWTLDQYNRDLISHEMELRINKARAEIIEGKIRVIDFRSQQRCPV